MSKNYKDLIAYLNKMVALEKLPYHTARTRKTAVRRVFSSQSNPGEIDILNANIDSLIEDFVKNTRETHQDISQSTIDTYRSRIKVSTDSFRKYLKEVNRASLKTENVETFDFPVKLRENLSIQIKGIPSNLSFADVKLINKTLESLVSALGISVNNNEKEEQE